MPTSQEEAQAAAAARKEARRVAHEAKMAADIAAKAEKKAARAAANAAMTEERKMSEFMQGKGMATQAYVNDASIPLAQFLPPAPPLPLCPAPVMHFADPALQADTKRSQEERRLAHLKNVEDQRQLALLRAEEKKRAYEASLEKQRQAAEANRMAKQQRKEENLRQQRESQLKAMLDRAGLELTVCCDQLLAAVQEQIQQSASQAGEVVRVTPNSFGGKDLSFTVKFKDPHATQTCLNMTLPPIKLTIPLFTKPAVVPACFLHFDLPEDIDLDEEVIPALQSLFSEFGTIVETKITPQRVALIHFQEPEAAAKVVDQQTQSQRTFDLRGQALSAFAIGKPSQGKRKRA